MKLIDGGRGDKEVAVVEQRSFKFVYSQYKDKSGISILILYHFEPLDGNVCPDMF